MSENSRKRILFFSEGWGAGGIESFIMNSIRTMDRGRFAPEVFCVHNLEDLHSAELNALEVPIHVVAPGQKPGLATRTIKGLARWNELLSDQLFDVVHINTMNGLGLAYARVAQKNGVPVRIVHSHNSSFSQGHTALKATVHSLCKRLYAKAPTKRLACSFDAGEYLFEGDPFEMMNNCIDVERFRFDEDQRDSVRERLEIPRDALLVGNIGRFSEAKNPRFQVEIFKELARLDDDAMLLMVGDGDLMDEVKSSIRAACLEQRARFVESTSAPEKYYSALDAFVMPSLYEGFPLVCVEAQCNGLPMLVSEALPAEAAITDLVRVRDLADGPTAWACDLVEMKRPANLRTEYVSKIVEAGFSLKEQKERLESIYLASDSAPHAPVSQE